MSCVSLSPLPWLIFDPYFCRVCFPCLLKNISTLHSVLFERSKTRPVAAMQCRSTPEKRYWWWSLHESEGAIKRRHKEQCRQLENAGPGSSGEQSPLGRADRSAFDVILPMCPHGDAHWGPAGGGTGTYREESEQASISRSSGEETSFTRRACHTARRHCASPCLLGFSTVAVADALCLTGSQVKCGVSPSLGQPPVTEELLLFQ